MKRYMLTDADGAPILGHYYDDPDRAIDARAQLMATHPDGDDVTVEPIGDSTEEDA